MYKNICPTHLFQLVSLVQQFDELVPGEVEEVGHLGLSAVEVLDAEGVDGHLLDAELAAPLQRLRQLLEARPVARDDLRCANLITSCYCITQSGQTRYCHNGMMM